MNIFFFEKMTKRIFNFIGETVNNHGAIKLIIGKSAPIPLISKKEILLVWHP